ncbi:MAG: hypothetical protein VX663_09580, partial [Pseudomonadota bacterium]|nr:hypothetical protein [Pseudomonadota bacterium]
VAGIGGAALPQSSDTYGNLVAALRRYGDPLVPLRVVDHRPVHFRVELAVKVAPEYETDAVLAAVEQALRDGFGFRARTFGQPVTLDEVSALAHNVAGVTAAKVLALYHDGPGVSPSRQFRLTASLPPASPTGVPVAAELLTLADAPLGIEVMA